MIEQTDLFDMPAIKVDESHWNIYEGSTLVGYFEIDKIGFEFKSCIDPICGGGGPLDAGEDFSPALDHAVKILRRHYKQVKGRKIND